MLGYYRDPEATAQSQRCWHHSGDLGQWDADGQLLFLDRIKDLIETSGENIPSIKVEEMLLRHPAVPNAELVGLPHARWGEAITSFVVIDAAQAVTAQELEAACRQHLGGFEVLNGFVQLAAMSVTSTGKIQKFELRQRHLHRYDAE